MASLKRCGVEYHCHLHVSAVLWMSRKPAGAAKELTVLGFLCLPLLRDMPLVAYQGPSCIPFRCSERDTGWSLVYHCACGRSVLAHLDTYRLTETQSNRSFLITDEFDSCAAARLAGVDGQGQKQGATGVA